MMPTEENYPKDFLRNTVTNVTVNIHGLIAETFVYQEFKNEWYDSTDAVFSFPLPPDARATEFVYWYNDKAYTAVLKVKEQATNPGTGEGGVAALVNKYIGRNGIKIFLKGIKAGQVQKTELRYISVCEYYEGKVTYKFPLNTQDFVQHTLDNLEFKINVNSNSKIYSSDIPTHNNFSTLMSTENELKLHLVESKSYLNKDFEFNYEIDPIEMGVDFYSVAGDTTDGHFALFVRPQISASSDSVHAKRIIFLLSNNSSMFGYKLKQSVSAIKYSLDQLSDKDIFNVVVYNYGLNKWKSSPVAATAENIQSAKSFLEGTPTTSGAYLQTAIVDALGQVPDGNFNNLIYIFTDGRASINPKTIETSNKYFTGIFPVGIGDDLYRAQLEMTAALNYGFVTYIGDNDNLYEKVTRLFSLTGKPLLKEVAVEIGQANVNSIMPTKYPSTYAGSMSYITGRYKNPGNSGLAIAGKNINGMTAYNFNLEFSDNMSTNKFAAPLWAKMMIDALEWEIEIYGESPDKKQQLIDISLTYNIRCRYTAYIADYETPATTSVDESTNKMLLIPDSYISGNYPNPFNPTTKIRIFINTSDMAKIKMLRIYNSLGQLVAVIDITNLSSGWQEIEFNGKDMFGNNLSSGVYFVQLLMDNNHMNTVRMNLVK
jgi:hypothetical protein